MRRELARTFGATLVVILTIVLTMLLIRTVGQAAKGQVSPQDVVLLLGFVALGQLPTMLALSLFVAIVLTLGRMYRDGEMVIWFASGIGLARFVRPVLRSTWPVLALVALTTLVVWPWGNRQGAELRERYAQRSDLSRVTPGVFQTSRDGSRVFFIERDSAQAAQAGEARNVFIVQQRGNLESVTSARQGRITSEDGARFLELERGQRNDVDRQDGTMTLAAFESLRVLADDPRADPAGERAPRTLSTRALLAEPTLRHQAELSWRLGLAFGAANLLLLGIGLAATQPRRASNWNLLFALLAFVVYFNLINLSGAWIAAGRLGLGASMALLHGGVFLLALLLIAWRDHATVWSLWPRAWGRRRAARGGPGAPA